MQRWEVLLSQRLLGRLGGVSLLSPDKRPWGSRNYSSVLLVDHPRYLLLATLGDAPKPRRTSGIPCMMSLSAVGTLVYHFLFRFVTVEALLGCVMTAANPTCWWSGAVCLVVTETLAAITAEGLRRVWTEVKHSPVPQVELRRKGPPDCNKDLPGLLSGTSGDASRSLFHLWVSLQKGKGHPVWISHNHTFAELGLRAQLYHFYESSKVGGQSVQCGVGGLVFGNEHGTAILPDHIPHLQVFVFLLEGCHRIVGGRVFRLGRDAEGWKLALLWLGASHSHCWPDGSRSKGGALLEVLGVSRRCGTCPAFLALVD